MKAESYLVAISPEDIDPLIKAAAADNHMVIYPTHTIKSEEKITGYVSICSAPLVMVWADTKSVTAAQSVRLLLEVEEKLKQVGLKEYIMPCAKTSPYFKYMEKLGFSTLGENVWFVKKLN